MIVIVFIITLLYFLFRNRIDIYLIFFLSNVLYGSHIIYGTVWVVPYSVPVQTNAEIILSIVFIAILMERNNLLNYFDDIGVVVIILISSIVITVFIITKIFINDLGSRRAILIEGLLQNGAMGFVVGSLIYSEVVYLIPIAIYSLLQYCALMFYIGNIRIKN